MALVSLSIPDELYAVYSAMNPEKPIQQALTKQLERFKEFPAHDRALIFPPEVRKALEGIYGGPVEDFEKFLVWVRSMAALKVDGVELVLSEGQRKRLVSEANFYERSYEMHAKQRLQQALESAIGY